MTLALTSDHHGLAEIAREFLEKRGAIDAAFATLEGRADAAQRGLPPYWAELVEMGWLGLHLPENVGGQGFGLLELAIVVEELGRTVAPGPLLPTAIASATVNAAATDEQRSSLLPGMASGQTLAAVALTSTAELSGGRVSGSATAVLGAAEASLFLVAIGTDLAIVSANDAVVVMDEGLDTTRSIGSVTVDGVVPEQIIVGGVEVARSLGRVLASAEATGGARACTEMAVAYAKEREQFGRTIGSFQAVKHHCANMLVDVELATAATWEAAEVAPDESAVIASAVAANRAMAGFSFCAEKNIQLHGGIGYTYEHPAHLYLRRAATLAALFDGPGAAGQVFDDESSGTTMSHSVHLPDEADVYRKEVRAFRATYESLAPADRHGALVDSGYFMPHWPKPFGRAADPIEQLVIEEVLGDIQTPNLGIGTWVLLTLVQSCTDDQIARWIRPGMMGEHRWCQLFSEPDAGSDAAAIKTKATRVDGGWVVNGQKVWTSGAQDCSRGLATVRTDPNAPKHAGVSAFVVDLTDPGVEIRPLIELTGESLFNEVFFTDVFVADDDVVGEVNQGWAVARATLGNERVSIGGNKGGLDLLGAADLVDLTARYAPRDRAVASVVGGLLAESHAMASLNLRLVMRAMVGGPPGPEGAITKLLSAEHAQRVAQAAMNMIGPVGIIGGEARATHTYLFSRCLSIAGGTSEITRNIIAERILGLPRDSLNK